MSNEDVHPAGAPTVGKSGPPVRDVSGETKTIGSTVRQNRSPDGKFARPIPHRRPELVRDTVTGRMMPGPSNAVLVRENDGLAEERLHRVSPGYSAGADPARKSNSGLDDAQKLVNLRLSCPTCSLIGG